MVYCPVDTISKLLIILFLISEVPWDTECACAQGREPGNSIRTQGLRLTGTTGNVQCARQAAGLSAWCTQHTWASQGPEDTKGWDSNGSRSSNGDSPGRKERHLRSLRVGPVVKGLLSLPALGTFPVAPTRVLTVWPGHQDRACLCSASRLSSELLKSEIIHNI